MSAEKSSAQMSWSEIHRVAYLKWRDAPPGMSPALADEFMQKVKSGKTIRMLTSGTKEYGPAIVTRERFKTHCELNPEWAQEVRALSDKIGRSRKGERLRNLTHCVYGHPFSGANLSFRPNGKRDCLTCVRRRALTPPPPTQKQIEQVTAALNMGKTLSLICQGVPGDQSVKPIVSFSKLGLYRKQNPVFDKFVISATAHNNSKGQLKRHHPEQVRLQIVRSQNDDFHKILAILPQRLANRDEIAASIFLALTSGTLQRDQVKLRLPEFIAATNRMFPTMFAKFGDSPLVSLDEQLFEDGATTTGDTISRGLWD
jgi:hypothetical protein